MIRSLGIVMGLALVVLASGCGSSKEPIKAGGSTLVYPMMSKWAHEYEKAHKTPLRYLSIGSGKGIEALIEEKVDFCCTESPLSETELNAARSANGSVIHIPLVFGALVPAYNLPDLKKPLKFSGQVLAEIYLGKIKRWDDDAIKFLNPDVNLPRHEIGVGHRLDSSGTTYIWTNYLIKASPEFKAKVEKPAKAVSWTVGTAHTGNGGVAAFVRRTPYSIGYIEQAYAYEADEQVVQFGLVENKEKKFVEATTKSVQAAFENAMKDKKGHLEIPDDLCFSFADALGPDSYPITGAVWAVLYITQPKDKGKEVAGFLRWAVKDGQKLVEGMHYTPLPEVLVEPCEKMIGKILAAP